MSWFLRDFLDDPIFFGRVLDPVTIGTSLAIGAASAGGSALLSKTLTKPPPKPPVTPIPDLNDPAELAAKKRQREDLQARTGRQSTILADDRASSGGDSYKGTVLGS